MAQEKTLMYHLADALWVILDEILLILFGSIVVFGIIFFSMTFLPEKDGR